MLAPYREHRDEEEIQDFLEFEDVKENYLEKYNNDPELQQQYPSFTECLTDYYGYQYDETGGGFGYWYNPNARWDWWVIGGRWTGYFDLKEGKTGELGQPGAFGNAPREGGVDIARKGDIDFLSKYEEFKEGYLLKANKLFELMGDVPYIPWPEYESLYEDIGDRRYAYWDQDFLKLLKERDTEKEFQWTDGMDFVDMLTDPDGYAHTAGIFSCVPYAIVDEHGWHERGTMGWCGISMDEDDNWDQKAWDKLQSYPDDAVFVLVDCHI